MRKKLWFVVLGPACLVASVAPTLAGEPGNLCRDLRLVRTAAEERPPFASIARPGESRPLMGFSGCGAAMFGESLICMDDYPDSIQRWRQLHDGIRACLPGARLVRRPGSSPPRADEHRAQFLVGRTLFTVDEAGYANISLRYVAIHVERVSRHEARSWATVTRN